MSMIDALLSVLAPYECLDCGAEGGLLCHRCWLKLPVPAQCCFRCHQPCAEILMCEPCSDRSPLQAVMAASAYEASAKAIVWQLKYNGARSAAGLMARLMHERLRLTDATVIVPVPTAAVRARQRGYDQAVLMARSLSRQSGLPYAACLARLGKAHQVGADRRQRLSQLENVFVARSIRRLHGAHILLVDDVLTTGATLETAAKVLLGAGAEAVSAAVFTQAI